MMAPRCARVLLAACAWRSLAACGTYTQFSTRTDLRGIQDAVLHAPKSPVPLGTRAPYGHLTAAGWLRVDPATTRSEPHANERAAHRTPLVSGAVQLGYGALPFSDAAVECGFSSAEGATRSATAMSVDDPHRGILWRCAFTQRVSYALGAGVRLTGGASFSVANALRQRFTDARLTVARTEYEHFMVRHVTSTTETRRYDERTLFALPAGQLFIGLEVDATSWLSFEAGSAVGFTPYFPRSMSASWFLVSGSGPTTSEWLARPEQLESLRADATLLTWLGFAVGPRVARVAARATVCAASEGTCGGVLFGAEMAAVFSFDVRRPRASEPR
jgi:hypothetical protein